MRICDVSADETAGVDPPHPPVRSGVARPSVPHPMVGTAVKREIGVGTPPANASADARCMAGVVGTGGAVVTAVRDAVEAVELLLLGGQMPILGDVGRVLHRRLLVGQ